MILGSMYYLDEVLQMGEQDTSHYLMVVAGEFDYEISFGRKRSLRVSAETYIVSITEDKYELERIEFREGRCDYLSILRDRNIAYEIPKTLPESINRMYSRFECAVGATWWSRKLRGFFGTNGYAITDIGYIGDDKYESYEISFCTRPGTFCIGDHAVTWFSGYEIPKDSFIIKLLEEDVKVEEGEPFIAMLKDAGICHHMDSIRFTTEEEDE